MPGQAPFSRERFIDFVKNCGKPAISAMLANAFKMTYQDSELALAFDKRYANLIGFLSGERNFKALQEATDTFFNQPTRIKFEQAGDPKLIAERKMDESMLAKVNADPKVQFVMENLKGSIVTCEPIKKKRKDYRS